VSGVIHGGKIAWQKMLGEVAIGEGLQQTVPMGLTFYAREWQLLK